MEMTREEFPSVHLLSLPGNIGWGAANNVGFRQPLTRLAAHPATSFC